MTAEKFCVSLETAKRLQEAGIVVDSYFHWVGSKFSARKPMLTFNNIMPEAFTYCEQYRMGLFKYPAPTAEELWSILPHRIDVDRCSYRLKLYKLFDDDILAEYEFNYTTPYYVSEDNKLCETLAKLAIKLKEAGCELNKFDK